ncbi:MAG: AsmA-like C-terminal region-containing protein, partial [Verrucomicrobiota bacterium]|nr:AsmA-like C-terminal region-containing protein [Verrucomicrobiota bacterium]
PIDRARGNLLITDDRVQLLAIDGTLFSGTVRGNADIFHAPDDNHYNAHVALEGVDFPRLTHLYFDYETSHGQLFGQYDWTCLSDEVRTMRGTGKLRVANGDVFAIPVLGPLSGLVNAIIPGAGYSVAKEATATFTINSGVIHTDDFKVSGKLFGLAGHGDIHFLDDRLDMDVRINASGAGVVLTPVYQLFEYKGEGSLAKPRWHPKRF